MTTYPEPEVRAAVDRYVAIREEIDAGKGDFGRLSDLFTQDAVVVDAAWGRIQGHQAVSEWFVSSMVGLMDWKFPVEFVAISGNDVVIKWTQIMPGRRPDGSVPQQSAFSRLVYAGDGRFCYEEDVYNMVHVMEDITSTGWSPQGGAMNLPPSSPNRDFSIPRQD